MKKGPIFLLVTLVVVLTFIVGVRYGQNIASTNKALNYLMSITPTRQPIEPTISYKTYTHSGCGITFLYPSNFEVADDSSMSAVISHTVNSVTEPVVTFNCSTKNDIQNILNDTTIKTQEVTFKNKKITAKSLERFVFKVQNPLNLKTVYFDVRDSFYPLFEKSVEFAK